tara:strand:+ start:640 stop:1275 length:636 start_codon:yes stop_codon:yes gene_type:complete
MTSEKKAINRLTNEKSKVSSHYFIKRNGELILMVPDLYIAWHAGKSVWKKYKSLNKYSIGIELSNKGHGKGYQKFSKKQILSLIRISKLIIKKYKIKKFNILGHSDVAYNRKKDPGEKFPWQFLAKKKIGIWHNLNNNNLLKFRGTKITDDENKRLLLYLSKIGYFLNKRSNLQIKKLLVAFQRRFRPELINGKFDRECLIIAKKLSKLSN